MRDDPVRTGSAAGQGLRPVLVNIESLLDPHVLMDAVRDQQRRIVDFRYRALNEAARMEYGLSREEIVDHTLLELHPLTGDRALFDFFVRLVETGEPLELDDFEFDASPPEGNLAYYDISAAKVGDGLVFSWWDVTQRYQRDREVAKAEGQLRATLDSLLDPNEMFMPLRDADGEVVDLVYTRVNEASCRYLKRTREQLIGHRLFEVWSGEAADFVFDLARQVLQTGQPRNLDEQSVVMPDGTRRIYDLRGVAIGDEVNFTYRDVTGRVMATKEIAESREHYRLLAENASELVFQTGADGLIEWASPSTEKVVGIPPEDFVGCPMSQFIHPEDLDRVRGLQKGLLAAGSHFGRTELRLATADGGWRWMGVLGRALMDDDGRLIGGVDAMRDIQAQRDAQAALAESEERFRRSMMDAGIGMAIVADDGTFLRVNPMMCQILGRTELELVKCTWQEITHPDDLFADSELLDGVLVGRRETYRLAKRYLRPDGEVVWADLTVSAVRDDEGSVRYLISQIVDITSTVKAREDLQRSEEHYRLMAENSSDVVFRSSSTGRLEWISPSVTEVMGWRPEEVVGQPMGRYVLASDLPESARVKIDHHEPIDFQGRCRRADGAHIWMDITSRPLVNSEGVVVGRVGRLRDIQAEHEAREALRSSEDRFRAAMESAPTGMAVIGLDRQFLEVNPALCQLLGRTERWLLSHSVADVLDPLDDDVDRRLRSQVLAGQVRSLSRDHQMIRSDGERLTVEHSIGVLRDDEGAASAFVSQFADVTEARQTREQLRFMATHDSLTELLNRRELVARVSGVLGRRPRTGVNVGVLFIDLDGLKPLNDTYGHAVGDEIIITVARRIKRQVRSDDIVARFGGDEFVLVLPAIHTLEDAEGVAGLLHSTVGAPMLIEGHSIAVTISIGVAVVRPGEDPDAAMRQADSALYRAKREGRARTVVYDPDYTEPMTS
jgi:diguanylate cyclase (GGDEF)-like protein/PAS domain S-box-containing protein